MTINATGSEDAWQRQALIEVTDGTSTMAMQALTETVDIDMGERDLDKIDLLNLGQIPKHGSVGITSVTFEGYPLQSGSAATGTGYGFFDIFASKPVVDSSQPLDVDMSNTLTKYRVAIMCTDDSAATTAGGATAASTASMRFVMAECFCTSCKTSFTDGILKQTLVFKGVAFDKSADSNIKMESHNDGAMVALGTYTPGTTKWA
jgi:hypothetical protein